MAQTVFSISMPGASAPMVERESTLGLFPPTQEEGPQAVESSITCFFDYDDEQWAELFGDDTSATVIVEVHEPQQIAGLYEVDLERKVTASAVRLQPAAAAESAVR